MISLMILYGGSHEGSLLSYGFWFKGFIWSRIVVYLHTVLVTIPRHIWCYVVVVFDFEHLRSLLSFSPGRGIMYDFGFCTIGYDGVRIFIHLGFS
jgi:hypothetical protein